jgi:hypothetical protein
MDLERELRALPVAWPETPSFAPVERRRRRWPVVVAIALAVAVGAAFAVPQSRGAILRFFHVGADRIERVDTLPPAEERPLGADLGEPVSRAVAATVVPSLLLPALDPQPPLHRSGEVVSAVFEWGGRPVLLSEVRGDEAFLKKLAGAGTSTKWVVVRDGADGLWLSGKPHVFFFPLEPARLAGNTLVWQEDGTTYRLEGQGLSLQGAIALAKSLRDTP